MDESPIMFAFAVGGLGVGIVLFGRGLQAYRRDRSISAVATSSLDGLAAGEVRVSGVVEVADQALISPLQSKPCVWYRSRVESSTDSRAVFEREERAVHFRVRDESGSIRVVPDGARWEIEPSFDASTSQFGEEPVGLQRRATAVMLAPIPEDPAAMSELQRRAAIDALLTVRQPEPTPEPMAQSGLLGTGTSRTGRRYREARLEPGETVTIVGQALPWADVKERLDASLLGGNIDRDIAADIADARASGSLVATPETAWGNAAIPGFGIGQPTRTPELDPDASVPDAADPAAHQAAVERHDIPAETLVLARGRSGTFAVYKGDAVAATQHHDPVFLVGLIGIVMAVSSALALGVMLSMST